MERLKIVSTGIYPITRLMFIIEDSTSEITSIAVNALKCCIIGKNYEFAYEYIIKQPRFEINVEHGIEVKDCLAYSFYAGSICLALKDFKRARH